MLGAMLLLISIYELLNTAFYEKEKTLNQPFKASRTEAILQNPVFGAGFVEQLK